MSGTVIHFLLEVLVEFTQPTVVVVVVVVVWFFARRGGWRRRAANKAGIFQNVRQGAGVHSVEIYKMLQAGKLGFPPI